MSGLSLPWHHQRKSSARLRLIHAGSRSVARAPDDANHRDILDQDQIGGHRLDAPRGKTDYQHARLPIDRAQCLLERVAADWVVDDIGALVPGQLAYAVADALAAVIDELVGAARLRDRELVSASGRGDDARAECLADFDRRQADSAGRAQHQERFSRLQMAAMRQRKIRGAVRHRKRRGNHEIHRLGDRHHGSGVEHDLLGVAATVAQHRDHPLPDAQTRNPAAGFDHLPRGFEPRRERERRLHLVGPADHQAVGEIDPGGAHPDADLARPQCAR
jgi:hypothetical protein